MKRRFLTFVMSCLLLAAFIGSAEAQKIDTTSNAGAAFADPSPTILNDLTAVWQNEDMKRLLALYYGIDEENYIIDPLADSTEVSSAGEDEDDVSGEEVLFGNTIAGLSFTDPLSNGPLAETSVSTDQEALAASAPSAAGTNYPLYYSLVPSASITINTGAIPDKGTPVGGSTPNVVDDSSTGKKDDKKPTPSLPPVVTVFDPVNTPTIGLSTFEKPKKDKILRPGPNGPKVEVPNDSIVDTPAPVPEPATMVLLFAGIAGLAIGRVGKK